MAKKTSVNMDEKAANAGDRMKHALSLEVLSRTNAWNSITYAETHAGAGVYLEDKQGKPPHIHELRDIVLWQLMRNNEDAKIRSDNGTRAGAAFLNLLKEWWFDAANHGQYPGSAKQATIYLSKSRADQSFEIRLTEKDEKAFKRLNKAVSGVEEEPRNRSFYKERDWLTEPDNLFLVVDPFRCVESFDLSDQTDINKGDIDHGVVRELIELCETKQAAVIHFWWSKRSQPGGSDMDKLVTASHKAARRLCSDWKGDNPSRAVREFQDKHNHASLLLGIGDGARVVEDIPGKDEWQACWLKPFLAESQMNEAQSSAIEEAV